MAKTTTSCPNCKSQIIADIEQLFDQNSDPQAKQKLLSGAFNVISCQVCGYNGIARVPIVYHDSEKELLLTFFPPDLGLPVNEQEKIIGPFINKVVNSLPSEARKAYLLQPKTMLTMESLIEKILESDGVTKEMLDAQRKRIDLLQRLLGTSEDTRKELIKNEEESIDQEFFRTLSSLIQASIAQGDQQSGQRLVDLQNLLVAETKVGQEMEHQAKEADAAIKSLEEASKNGLTREALLDLVVSAPTDIRLTTLVGVARSGMDYEFFQLLSTKIENASGDKKQNLLSLREKLLTMTEEIDKAIQEQVKQAKQLLDKILDAKDPLDELKKNLSVINNYFVDLLTSELQQARDQNDLERSAKLQDIMSELQKYSAPPPEIKLIEELLSADDQESREKILEENAESINSEFIQLLNNVAAQSDDQKQPVEIQEKIKTVYNEALRFSMKKNL